MPISERVIMRIRGSLSNEWSVAGILDVVIRVQKWAHLLRKELMQV